MKQKLKCLVVAALIPLCFGCKSPPPAALTAPPTRQGIFLVTSQGGQKPTVEVKNDSDTPLRLLLNASDGTLYTLDVGARSDGTIDVPTGHYDAKVVDVNGHIKSAFGSADITEYRRYTTGFVVEPGGHHSFHIGG